MGKLKKGEKPSNLNYDTIDKRRQRGPFSPEERKFIEDHYEKLSPQEIGTALRRTSRAIIKYVEKTFGTGFQKRARDAEYNIQATMIWKDLEKQFTKEELKMFLYHWGRIISQFKDDVYPTEQMQVIDTVKLEILMNRALTQQNKCIEEISGLEVLLKQERSNEQTDMKEIYNIEKQIGILRAAQESLNDSYRDLLNKKNSILKEMKATRDARIKSIESGKHSFVGWMRRLLEDPELRLEVGKKMEKMRLAAHSEYERLSEYHIYDDGVADQPLLTSENIKEE